MENNKLPVIAMAVFLSVLTTLICVLCVYLVVSSDNDYGNNQNPTIAENDKTQQNEDGKSEEELEGSDIKANKILLKFESQSIESRLISNLSEILQAEDVITERTKTESIQTVDAGTIYTTEISVLPSGGCRKFIHKIMNSLDEDSAFEINCYTNQIIPSDGQVPTTIYEITSDENMSPLRTDVDTSKVILSRINLATNEVETAELDIHSALSDFSISSDGEFLAFFDGYKDGSLNVLDIKNSSLTSYETGTPYEFTAALGAAYDTTLSVFSPYNENIFIIPVIDTENLSQDEYKHFQIKVINKDGELLAESGDLLCRSEENTWESISKCVKWTKINVNNILLYQDPVNTQENVEEIYTAN